MVLVQIDRSFAGNRKILRAASKLGISETQMAGMLVYLWSWAADNAPDGDLSEVGISTIAREMVWDGDAAELVNALTEARLMDTGNGKLRIHDWEDHMGAITAKREKTRNRQRRFQARRRALVTQDNALVTQDNALLTQDNALVTQDNALLTQDNALVTRYANPLDMLCDSDGYNDAYSEGLGSGEPEQGVRNLEKAPLASSPPSPPSLLPPSLSPPSSPPTTPVSPPSISPPNHPAPSTPLPPDTPKESTLARRVTQNSISLEGDGKSTRAQAKAPVKRKKRGEHGWVLLSDEEYGRLCKDLGAEEAQRCIAYVDEAAKITRNKNGWKDWNLVVRKCHREGWSSKGGQTKKPSQDSGNPFFALAARLEAEGR